MSARSYRDLIAWQKAVDCVVAVYAATQGFPKEELFGLTSQIRRAAVSIPSNIAEGQARKSKRELLHFLAIAAGSLAELETQLLIAYRLRFLDRSASDSLLASITEVARLIAGLTRSLR